MTTTTIRPAVLVTANRAVVYGTVSRWLLHDLRNPTQALSLVTELLSEPGTSVDADLQTTLSESTRQLTYCVELLDRAMRAMPSPATPAPVVLSEVLQFLARLFHSRRSSTQLDFSQVVGQPLPAIAGVEDHLEHTLLNLLMNAIEAIGDRENGQVVMTAVTHGDAVELAVDDNGPGVAPELRDRLFEPYTTTKRHAVGAAGLGLTVARYLVERSGGTVAYTPKDGPGARFVARLPAWPSAGSESRPISETLA